MLFAMAKRHLANADRLARCFPDRRDPTRITYTLADTIRARFAISRSNEDADDLGFLCTDPAVKLARGQLRDTGSDSCSQPTLSRLENAPSLKDTIRLTRVLVDRWMASYVFSRARVRHARHRRHVRCRAWTSAIVAIQRAFRRTLFST